MRTRSYRAPKRVKQKLPRGKGVKGEYLEEETGPSARGGRIGRGDGGGAATMLASMEPWSTGGDG